MANNFFNAVQRNVSADSTLPTAVYTTPASKKSILIELDVANKSSSGVTVTVQICDASANSSGTGNAHTASAIATNTTGLITTTSSAAHLLSVNDRIIFTNGTDPSFTDAALPPSGDTALKTTGEGASGSRMYYVQSVTTSAPYKFTIAESESATTALTFDNAGSGVRFAKVHLADIVRDAPVPVGGSLKVISGQKLVIESLHASVNDKIFVYSAAANGVDCIASVLEDVS